jgi:hypothetical protein
MWVGAVRICAVILRPRRGRAGLHAGAVIVALNGNRIHAVNQYTYFRNLLPGPDMDLIVWQDASYYEVKADPPAHLFGVAIADFHSQ